MANKDTGLVFPVSAEADVDSAKKAGKALEKGVFSSIPDGYISIPAKIKVPIKKASPELKEAQEKLIKQWERVFSNKGFSSSKKEVQELDKLNAAYSKFDQLVKKEKKWKSTQYQELSKRMEIPMKEYKLLREELTGVKLKEPKIKSTSKKNKKSKSISTDVAKGKRNYSGSSSGSVTKEMDYPTRSTDTSTATQQSIHASDKQGPYRSKFNEQTYRSQAEERANEKKSLKLVAVLNEFNKERFRIEKSRLDRTALTSQEAHKGLADVKQTEFRDNLALLLKEEIDFKEYARLLPVTMQEAVAHYEKAGKDLNYIIDKLSNNMVSFFYRVGGRLGVDYTKEGDIPMSEKSYYEDMEKAWKAFFAIVDKLQYVKGANGLNAFEAAELKEKGGKKGKWDSMEHAIDAKEAYDTVSQHLAEDAFIDIMQGTIPDTKISLDSDAAKAIAEAATNLKTAGDTIGKAVNLTKKRVDKIISGAGLTEEKDSYQNLFIAIGYYLRMIYNVTKAIRDNKRWRSRW